MIRLILIDIDGTLVGHAGVHASTWPAVHAARERGVHLALCTGRIGRGRALEYARRVAPEGLHVFQSGAVISRPDAPAARASTLPRESCRALIDASRREREPVELYSEREFYLEWHTPLTRVHEERLELPATITDLTALEVPIVRAQWVVNERDWPKYRAITEAAGGLESHPATAPWSPGTVFSNLVRSGTSKAAALRWLAAHFGLGVEEVAMVGDGENDLDAIEAAGLGIAVGNAPPHVRAKARRVVADADDGGLAEAIAIALGSA